MKGELTPGLNWASLKNTVYAQALKLAPRREEDGALAEEIARAATPKSLEQLLGLMLDDPILAVEAISPALVACQQRLTLWDVMHALAYKRVYLMALELVKAARSAECNPDLGSPECG